MTASLIVELKVKIDHTTFITVTLYSILKSGSASLPTLFLFEIVLAIWGSFCVLSLSVMSNSFRLHGL